MTAQEIESALSHATQLADASNALIGKTMGSDVHAVIAGSVLQHHHLVENVLVALKIAISVEQAAEHIPFIAALPYAQILPILDTSLRFIEGYVERATNPS